MQLGAWVRMNRSWLQETSGWPKHNFCLKCWNMLNYFVNLSHTNSVQHLHFWSVFWQTAHLLVFWEAPVHPENVQEWISWCKVSPKKLKLKKLPAFARVVDLMQKCGFQPLCGWRIRWCLCPSACSRCHCHSDHSVTLVVRLFIRLCSKRSKIDHATMPQLSSEFLHGLRLLLFHFCRFPHKSPVVDLENTLKDRTVPKVRIWDINSLIHHKTFQFCRAILSSWHKYVAKRGFLH